jgi:GNAT superfamily N-acetyltransferase
MTLATSKIIDLKNIATCHRLAFPDSYASKLGEKYCMKMFEWYIDSNNGLLFHLLNEKGICIGYCGSIINDGKLDAGSSSSIMQYSYRQGIKSLCIRPWLIFHSEVIANYKLIQKNIFVKLGLKKHARTPVSKEKMSSNPHMGLVVIGVRAKMQGKGIGGHLLKELEKRTNDFGIKKMKLTVEEYNKTALKAYIKNGWEISSSSSGKIFMSKAL